MTHPRFIKLNPNFIPCTLEKGNEYFKNGIFVFNITKLIEHIDANKDKFTITDIDVDYYCRLQADYNLNQDYVKQADITRPLILAEISPDKYDIDLLNYYWRGYSLIDGHHRIAKAHELGIKNLKAYIIPMEEHINF